MHKLKWLRFGHWMAEFWSTWRLFIGVVGHCTVSECKWCTWFVSCSSSSWSTVSFSCWIPWRQINTLKMIIYTWIIFVIFREVKESVEAQLQRISVPLSLVLLTMLAYLVAGSILFCLWENWTFLDSFYFCYISLTTIGL